MIEQAYNPSLLLNNTCLWYGTVQLVQLISLLVVRAVSEMQESLARGIL
jgi:hypothetical protein